MAMMCCAMRSLMEPDGLRNSALARIFTLGLRLSLLRSISGVPPMSVDARPTGGASPPPARRSELCLAPIALAEGEAVRPRERARERASAVGRAGATQYVHCS